jgi:hypothetical protein
MKILVRYSIYSLFLFIACFMTSCGSAQVGRNFQPIGASRIEMGKTTKADVLEIFGEPFTVTEVTNWKCPRAHFGHEEAALIWRYRYESSSLFSSSAKSMQVEFDAAGRVIDYDCHSTFPEDAAKK